jgi:CspA family cold shock protein
MAETWNKRERERKKRLEKKEKLEKRQERKQNKGHQDWTDLLAYVDENGNLSSKPSDSDRSL